MAAIITTKYFGPTTKRPARIQARCKCDKINIPYNWEWTSEDNHMNVARMLATKLNWVGNWVQGDVIEGNGKVYVLLSPDEHGYFTIK